MRALFKDMAPRGGTVLGLALSWVLSGVIQCSSTDKSNVSTCLGESSWDTTLEPWNIQIEYVNWGRMKLDMLKKLRLYRKLDYIYLGDNIIVDVNFQYCQQMSLGFRIETIETAKNAATAVMPRNRTYQILTDICHLGNLSFVKSIHNKALLNDSQM